MGRARHSCAWLCAVGEGESRREGWVARVWAGRRTPSLSLPAKAGNPVFQRQCRDTEEPRRTGYPAFAGMTAELGDALLPIGQNDAERGARQSVRGERQR